MQLSTSKVRERCRSALIGSFKRSRPEVVLDHNGYSSSAIYNLLDGVKLSDFESDLRQGDGNELEGKFRAAHSSSALAVNTFSPFKTRPHDLILADCAGFEEISFERKCFHGLAGRRSPNLDVLANGPEGIVAVESKCLEYLSPHRAVFSPAYEAGIIDGRRETQWFEEMRRLNEDTRRYRWLDAAQLVKHAFGLSYTFQGRPTKLLYLFWEPTNAGEYSVFAEHRAEVDAFKNSVATAALQFCAMSYGELWQSWSLSKTEMPQAHITQLRKRYEVEA
jgi:hypothetical protein